MRLIGLISLVLAIAPISLAFAAGNQAAGRQDFTTFCAGCHSTAPGQNGIGPSLAGVVGRKSGSETGYQYSTAMTNAHVTWNSASLNRFLANPAGTVRGTKMFQTVPDAAQRQDIIAYLTTLK